MKLLRAYRYLFHRIYLWQVQMFGEKNNPKFVAILLVSIFVFVHLNTAVIFYQIWLGSIIEIDTGYGLVALAVIAVFNYFILIYDGQFEEGEALFSGEDVEQRRKGTIACWIYFVATHLTFLVSAVFLPGRFFQ